ncbi:hypothetical protein PGT21_017413 [Puccinia graminis f. sp. tritici]|uniref:RING-type domain-containing protein n=1 Tax=Puccinia graminis f. sp. tritici TaxID=56615 RepID=A0A5B0LUP1_PUCGR|nr:hypothetical protein PGT21_017413 [Puccinia graminis f. sp. tritici]KAA1093454.1 hypothetical protein PGTUg99_017581 [Puccinia graminis f. sp. tritici]
MKLFSLNLFLSMLIAKASYIPLVDPENHLETGGHLLQDTQSYSELKPSQSHITIPTRQEVSSCVPSSSLCDQTMAIENSQCVSQRVNQKIDSCLAPAKAPVPDIGANKNIMQIREVNCHTGTSSHIHSSTNSLHSDPSMHIQTNKALQQPQMSDLTPSTHMKLNNQHESLSVIEEIKNHDHQCSPGDLCFNRDQNDRSVCLQNYPMHTYNNLEHISSHNSHQSSKIEVLQKSLQNIKEGINSLQGSLLEELASSNGSPQQRFEEENSVGEFSESYDELFPVFEEEDNSIEEYIKSLGLREGGYSTDNGTHSFDGENQLFDEADDFMDEETQSLNYSEYSIDESLEEADDSPNSSSFEQTDKILNTVMLGYMPKEEYLIPHEGMDTVPVNEVLKYLGATIAECPVQSGINTYPNGMKDFLSAGMENAGRNLDFDGTVDFSQNDQNFNQKPIENCDEISNLNPSLEGISDFILGEPHHRKCAFCQDEFKSPKKDSKNVLSSMDTVLRIENCGHYYHPLCLKKWVLGHGKHRCILCWQEFPISN